MPAVGLREIVTAEDRTAVMSLRRAPGQENYVSSMQESFAEADAFPRAMPRAWAVHDAGTGTLVGFAMISDNIPQDVLDADPDLVGPYFLWRLLIDAEFQGRGYGRATIDAVADYVRSRPGGDILYTSCEAGDGSPQPFYLQYGFTKTDRVADGEDVLRLDLEPAT